uniref:Fatty acid synthase n=1 Tax=Panagrolaimus sp. ES5 TaxID=591445 RepID=A0AC34GRT1_9BILA
MEKREISFFHNAYLKDHTLFGRIVISAATLIVEISKIFCDIFDSQNITLIDIFFLEPIFVSNAELLVTVIVDKKLKRFEVITNDGKIAVVGKFEQKILSIPTPNLMKPRKNVSPMEKCEFYKEFLQIGYEHSGIFQSVQKVFYDNENGIVEIVGDKLDVAFDGLMQAVVLKKLFENPHGNNELTVPFSIKEIKVFPEAEVMPLTILKGIFNENSFSLHSSFAADMPLIEAKGVVFKRICRPSTPPSTITIANQDLFPSVIIRSAACRLPGGIQSLQDFATFLEEGKTSDSKIPAQRIPSRNSLALGAFGKPLEGGNFLQQNIAEFDPAFFGISKLEARAMDPQQRLLLEVIWECFENAGVTDFQDCGFFVGQMGCEYAKADGTDPPNALQIVGEANSVLAGRLNFFFGSNGPSESIDTACSSSMVALQNAVDSIKLGRCKRAIVAGTSLILSSNELAQRISGNLLSKDGICHSFDVDADGYGRGEGVVAILIEAENDSEIPRYLAKIDSIVTNHGGRSAALTAPNGMAHFMLIEKAIAESGHLQVDYWECHGTGTSLGDPIELSALQKVFTKYNFGKKVLLGTSKASLGHCEGAAGIAGILKAIVVLQQQYSTSLPRFRLLNKNIKTDGNTFGITIIGEELIAASKTFVAGVSSFGVSGTNVAAILSSPNTKVIKEIEAELLQVLEKQGIAILPFSAKSQASLDSLTDAYSTLCFRVSNKDFSLLSAAAALSRKQFKLKSVFIRTRTGEISQITSAKASGICFKVDCLPSVAWDLIFRISEYKKTFLEKLKTLIDPTRKTRKTQIIRSLKISDIWAKWNFLHSLGIIFDHIVADSEEEQYFAEEILQLFPTDATIITSENIKTGSIVFGSSAYQIQDSTNLNHIIAAAYLQGQEINWAKVFSLSESQRNLLPFHQLPNYQFDRQIYWSKKICDEFDHKILGNIIFDSETEIRLENWILERRLKDIFMQISETNEKNESKDILEISVVLELLITVAKAILKNIGFEIREFEVIFPLELSALKDDVWFKTIIELSESEDSLNVTTKISSYSPKQKEETVFFKFKFMLIPNKLIPEEEPKTAQLFQDWTLNFEEIFEAVEASHQLKATNIKFIRVLKGKGDDEDAQSLTPNLSEGRFFVDMKNEWQLEIIYQKDITADKINPLLQNITEALSHHFKAEKKILSKPNNLITIENIQIKLIKALKEAMDSEIILEESELINRGFIDLGLDSLSLMALLNELNLKYFKNIELTTTDLFTYTNVQSLSEIIHQRLNDNDNHQNDVIEKEEQDESSSRTSDAESSQVHEESTAENTSISDSTPPNSPNIDFFNPSPKNVYEIISFVPEIPDSSRIIIHFNDQTSLAEAHFDSTVIQLSSPSSFTTFLEKLRLITYSEYSFVFRFDPLPPRPSLIQPETIQFLLTFASTLAKLRRKLCFTVIENENPLSGLFSGFWKSFVVEKMNISRFNFTEKIRPFGNFNEQNGIDSIPHGNWLITGGTNGIGLVMAKHLASFPTVSQVYVLSRKGILPKSYHKIKPMKIDVTRFDQIQNLFCTLDSIDGVIHSAGTINDAIIERQTIQSFEKVISPKVDGLKNIIKSLKYFEFKPKYLILNSSVSSLLGNFGQTNYSSANAAAEKLLVAFRKSTGIGSIIHWGNWAETGMG